MMMALSRPWWHFLPRKSSWVPFAGVWIDRLKRKHVAIAADMFIGLVAVVFAVLLWMGHPPYWSACAVLGIRALGSVFHTPAIQSIVPQLVPPDKLVRANGWNQFMQSGAFMLGPVIGAAMYAALPLPVILLTDFIGACAASLTMAVVTIPEPEHSHQEAPHLIREMKEGLSICMSDRRLMKLTAAAAITMVFYLPLASYYPLMSSTYFKASAWHGSAVEFLYALGMMVSAIIFGSLGKVNNKLKASYLGLAGSGITCVALPGRVFLCGTAAPFALRARLQLIFRPPAFSSSGGHARPRAFKSHGFILAPCFPVRQSLQWMNIRFYCAFFQKNRLCQAKNGKRLHFHPTSSIFYHFCHGFACFFFTFMRDA